VDAKTGNLYVSEDHDIRLIADGSVSPLAGSTDGTSGILIDGTADNARFNVPYGLAFDPGGNLIVTDYRNHAIRKVSPDGMVTTIAGARDENGNGVSGDGAAQKDGLGDEATFSCPLGVAVDTTTGVIYVSDSSNHNIRKITPCTDAHPCAKNP